MSATFVKATRAHVEALATQLRPADLAEIAAEGCPDPLLALQIAVDESDVAYAMLLEGELSALFGLRRFEPGSIPGAPDAGIIWLLSGTAVDRHRLAFARCCGPALERLMLSQCGCLVNYVDARYEAALRWVRWLGFTVGPPQPFGPQGLLFRPIAKRRAPHGMGGNDYESRRGRQRRLRQGEGSREDAGGGGRQPGDGLRGGH